MAKSTKITNDNSITLSELKAELRERWDLPFSVFVSGPAGVGKSAVFKQLVAEIATGDPFAKWEFKNGIQVCGEGKDEHGFIDYRLAQIEPQDLAGIPMPENGTTRRFLPSELPVVGNDRVPEVCSFLTKQTRQISPSRRQCSPLSLTARLQTAHLSRGGA